jgi:AcrR family transcriptional regulator
LAPKPGRHFYNKNNALLPFTIIKMCDIIIFMSREETIFGDDWPYSKAKTALLRAAAQVMRESGPRSATIKNIAGNAGVTEPAIFRHFDGVEGVFMSLFNVVEMYFDYFDSLYASDELAGIERFEAAFIGILETLKDNADFSYILVQPDPIFRQYPKLKQRLADLRARDKESVMACLKEARSKKQLLATTDPETLALSIVGATMLLMQAWTNDSSGFDLVKEGKKLWNNIKAMAVDPEAAPATKGKPKVAKKKA